MIEGNEDKVTRRRSHYPRFS